MEPTQMKVKNLVIKSLVALVDQWMDYVALNVANDIFTLSLDLFGILETDHKHFNKVFAKVKDSLSVIENHLKLRNFLVGYSLSIADVYLVTILTLPL